MAAKPPRHSSEVLGNVLRITIPSPKGWPIIIIIIFLVVWLALWSYVGGALMIWPAIVRGEGGVFLILFLSFWALGEIVGIYELLWQLVGKEEIEVAPDSIAIRQAILGIGWYKVYASEHISRMRADAVGRVEPYALDFDSEGVSMSKGTGMIAFDYKEKTIRMGIGVDEAEAKELVAEIQRQYPQYKK